MSEHRIALTWAKGLAPFTYAAYPRNHEITFKGGAAAVTASASPEYRGDAARPDPEDLLVAALSSCHMLSFLALASRKKLSVEAYEDDAVGFLEDGGGHLWISRVVLQPKVIFATDPGAAVLAELHEAAHRACFIANSVRTDVTVAPR